MRSPDPASGAQGEIQGLTLEKTLCLQNLCGVIKAINRVYKPNYSTLASEESEGIVDLRHKINFSNSVIYHQGMPSFICRNEWRGSELAAESECLKLLMTLMTF